jgi:hypothetical protein
VIRALVSAGTGGSGELNSIPQRCYGRSSDNDIAEARRRRGRDIIKRVSTRDTVPSSSSDSSPPGEKVWRRQ